MSRYTRYEVVADVSPDPLVVRYARVEHRGRSEWRTKRTAEKHAREYRATHLRDAWVNPIW